MVGNGEKWWESEDAMKLERGMSDEQIKAATHDLGCMMCSTSMLYETCMLSVWSVCDCM